ncbi:MAG: hypothetical protein ACK5KO_04620 [Arachnia sp.]
MTEQPLAEIQQRLHEASSRFQTALDRLSGWDDAAAARVRTVAGDATESLDQAVTQAAELSRHSTEAVTLADNTQRHLSAADTVINDVDHRLPAADQALSQAQAGRDRAISAARESGSLTTAALKVLSGAGAPCGLSTGLGALEGEMAASVRSVRMARFRRVAAASAATNIGTEAAWMAAEKVATGALERASGVDDATFGGGWDQVRSTAELIGPWTAARVRSWSHSVQGRGDS